MRKVILVTVAVLLGIPTFGFAGDIDGIWWMPELQWEVVWMIRENAGTVVGIFLSLPDWPYDAYDVMIGQMAENVWHAATATWSLADARCTVTFETPSAATVYVESCKLRTTGGYCSFPPGVSFRLEKIF